MDIFWRGFRKDMKIFSDYSRFSATIQTEYRNNKVHCFTQYQLAR